jgi:(R,R)-butanediol dehydrogenase/meso-butanediol dehydrogenase/diacetyl reductase
VKLVRVHGPDDFRIDEVAEPQAGPRDAVVRVASCGICGTDLRYVRQGGLIGPSDVPMPIGHELSGVIDSVGAEVEGLAVGTRVVLNPTGAGNMIGNGGPEGGFAPKILVRNAAEGRSLFTIPDSLPDHIAALAEPLGVGMNAVDRSEARVGEKVVVVGAGPIGLAAIATLADRGVEDVVAIDLSPKRLEIARALGARATINAAEEKTFRRLRELHGEEPVLGSPMVGSDVYIEASGAGPMIPKIIGQAKAESRLAVVALHSEDIPVNFLVVMMKQMTIRGAMEYPSNYREMIDLLERRDLSPMISHRFQFEQFAEAFAVARDPQSGGKVVIDL